MAQLSFTGVHTRGELTQAREELQTALTAPVVIEQAEGQLAGLGHDADRALSATRWFARGANRQLGEAARAVRSRRLGPSRILGADRSARPRSR